MKELGHPPVGPDEARTYNQRVKALAPSLEGASKATYLKGDAVIEVSVLDETTYATRINTRITDIYVEEKEYLGTDSAESPHLNYNLNVYELQKDGTKKPISSKSQYLYEIPYGLHDVTAPEYQELMEVLTSLKPEDKMEES